MSPLDPASASIRLAPFAERHVPVLGDILADPDVLRFTRVPDPPPPDFARTWVSRYEAGREDGSREAFAIEDAAGAFLGLAVAPRIDREARTLELGYVVSPHARGRGVATRALLLLTDWALGAMNARRLELIISVANEPSKVVARRCGYTREGVLRELYFKQQIWEDTEIWSRLASDPAPERS